MLNRFLFIFLLLLPPAVFGQSRQEADLKAAFIFNFTRYIEWDSTTFDRDFVIGVIGTSPIMKPLGDIARTNTVKGKRIIVRYFNKPDDIVSCQILFIPRKLPYSLPSILERTGRGTLTVSEEPGYAKQGTSLNFIVVNDKLKFEANLRSIYLSGLRAGSQLLKLAIIVE